MKAMIQGQKKKGNNSIAGWTIYLCPVCGECRVRTDRRLVWCSYVKCHYWDFIKDWKKKVTSGTLKRVKGNI